MLAELRGDPDLPILRIEFRLSERPDPRAQLAESADLSDDDVAEIEARLDRLDRAASYGPWTRAVLRAIDDAPAVRAGIWRNSSAGSGCPSRQTSESSRTSG